MEENTLEEIKLKILNLVENNCGLIEHGIMNDYSGYIYCIYNSLYDIYDEKYYKVGNTINLDTRFVDYDAIYFEPIQIKLTQKVPYKYMFEMLLFKKLKNNRVRRSREFFKNYELIKNEFNVIKNIVENNDNLGSIQKYYIYVTKNLDIIKFSLDEVLNLKKNKNQKKTMKLCRTINYNLNVKNYFEKYKNKIANYNSKNTNVGYLYHLDIPEITYNFNNKVQVVQIEKNNSVNYTEFISNVNIKNKIKIYDVSFTKFLIFDMLNNLHIKKIYFCCDENKIKQVFDKIKKYHECYYNVEKIKKAYLYEMYNEGVFINHDKISNNGYEIDLKSLNNLQINYKTKIEKSKKICESDDDNLSDFDDNLSEYENN